jgi:hypothetical protein
VKDAGITSSHDAATHTLRFELDRQRAIRTLPDTKVLARSRPSNFGPGPTRSIRRGLWDSA